MKIDYRKSWGYFGSAKLIMRERQCYGNNVMDNNKLENLRKLLTQF